MGDATTKVFKLALWTSVVLCLGLLKGVTAQTPSYVIALEANDVRLTFLIPNTDLENEGRYILLRHDNGAGRDQTEVVFFMTDGPKIKNGYSDRLTINHKDGRVQMLLRNVSAADAGTFRCFSGSSTTIIPNCGQLLIIIRKPNRPTVKLMQSSTSKVGSDLHLVCEANSASLPPNHGLKSELFWYDRNGDYIAPSFTDKRIHVTTKDSHLVIKGLLHADHGLKFSCSSADKTEDQYKRILSDRSNVFEILPEYRPAQTNLKLTPEFHADEIVRKVIGHQLTYRCDAECVPSCQVVWRYRPYGGAAGFGEVKTLVDKKILTLDVTRINEGLYQCRAENIHGSIYREFYLESLYITHPKVHINGKETASIRLLEGGHVNLTCVFDSNPGPVVRWSSPSKGVLSSGTALGPQEKLASNGIHLRYYTSDISLSETRCEDSGVYKCEGRNNVSFGEGRIHVLAMCPPSKPGIPGLDLLSEYVWDLTEPLTISFVIRAVPEADITRIMSTVRGQHRMEVVPRDFDISKSKSHNGMHYLTKFTLTSRRNLDESDAGRVVTLSVESSEFTKDFSFMIRPRGPPQKVTNLTADVGHDSLYLSWVPGFNGGESQTFSVEHHIVSPAGQQLGPPQLEEDHHWTLFQGNISDVPVGTLVQVQIRSLRSSTDYIIRVTAVNKLGTNATELPIKTADPPDKSLGAGAIAGIVICVFIIVTVIAVGIYLFVCKRMHDPSQDDENGELRNQMIPQPIVTEVKQDRSNNVEEGNGGVAGQNGSGVKESHWLKVKDLLKRKSAKKKSSDTTEPSKSFTDVGDDGKDNSGTEDPIVSPILTEPVETDE